eukprot:1137447-Pelagomonas_calceolata.AAC.2
MCGGERQAQDPSNPCPLLHGYWQPWTYNIHVIKQVEAGWMPRKMKRTSAESQAGCLARGREPALEKISGVSMGGVRRKPEG